jgi:putative transposase
MDNQVYLLFKSGEVGLSTVMRKVLTWCAQYFNRRYRRTGHLKFVKDGLGQKHAPQFSGGGLIWSQGGWCQVLSLRQKAQKEEYDARILGSGDFVQAILKEAEEEERRQMKIRRVGLIEEELEKSDVSLQDLKKGSRRKVVSGTRAKIARRGL